MPKEMKFNEKFREEMKKRGMMIRRVENRFDPGMPDNYFCVKDAGVSGWIEMKELDSKPYRVYYEMSQIVWHIQFNQWGVGKLWTVVNVPKHNLIYIIPGSQTRTASQDLSKIQHSFILTADLWDDVFNALTSNPMHLANQPRKRLVKGARKPTQTLA